MAAEPDLTSALPANQASGFKIVARHQHRSDAYTQGLLFDENGALIESSGHYGRSNLVKLELNSGDKIQQQYSLPKRFFAEGAAQFGGWLYLLTWRAGKCLVLNPNSLKAEHTLAYSGEGWGLTANDSALIMSDGSDALTFRAPANFKTVKTLRVQEQGKAIKRLNELEWARGHIYANIWYSDDIVVIDPDTGQVEQRIDLSSLRDEETDQAEVLNGIAYHKERDTFFVTGKYWSTIYELTLPPPKNPLLEGSPTKQ